MADVSVDATCKNSKELLAQGVRAYVLQDYNSAVQALSRVTELLVEEHGDDLHDSLGEVYLYYGKALLALSRDETDALGDAVPKNEEDDAEEDEGMVEGDEGEEDEGEAENDENEEKEKEENGENESEEKKNGEQKESKIVDDDEDEGAAGPSGQNSNKGEGDEETEEKGDEEATDLQVAWEVLELAKKIYERKAEDGKKHLAETLIALGEVSLESENFEASVADMKQGLDLQKELYSKDSRTVAETLYKLGVAYSTNTQIEEAVDCFGESLEYLKNRINVLEGSEGRSDSAKDEIAEIKSLMPDIEEKIQDMKNYKEEDKCCDGFAKSILDRFECLRIHLNIQEEQ